MDGFSQGGGGQSSAPQVNELVFQVLYPEGRSLHDNPAVIKQRRVELVSQLREEVRRKSWKQNRPIAGTAGDLDVVRLSEVVLCRNPAPCG